MSSGRRTTGDGQPVSPDGRPRFHIVPPGGWLNDPNGLIRVDGTYHVFYQHNPTAAVWEAIHWGHASSTDLVRWRTEPIALRPSPDGPDEDGCWSGSAVMTPEGPVIFYTGRSGERETICRAFGDAELRTWRKDQSNPVIEAPPDMGLTDFRDPKVWRGADGWHMIVGAGLATGAGAVLHLRSDDLRDWRLQGPILSARATGPREAWECPDLFRADGRDVLIYSVTPGHDSSRYVLGTWDGRGFEPERWGHLDLGPYFYAGQALAEPSGRVIVWGWLREGRSVESQRAAGWSGMLSIPRSLRVGPDGRLATAPLDELAALRLPGHSTRAVRLAAAEVWSVRETAGPAWEARVVFSAESGARLRVRLCASPDDEEATLIECDPQSGALLLDRRRSSLAPETDADVRTFGLWERPRDRVELRIFVDGTAIETFIDGQALTTRVYPSRADSTGISLEACRGAVRIETLDWWPLNGQGGDDDAAAE
jgi:beta-fructofuranosidase